MINAKAIYALPTELFPFYKSNVDYLAEHAVDPDKRRYAVKEEGPRHYIDLDHYLKATSDDILSEIEMVLPFRWDSAVKILSEDTLMSYGLLPWHLNLMVLKLTSAFKSKERASILKLSAEIGHYASDAHVPLHTTENYNGQLTDQKGIHALWESRIPERKAENFDFLSGTAYYMDNVQNEIWQVVASSHSAVSFVLSSEKKLRNNYDADKIYRPSTVGRKVSPQFTSAYVDAYAKSNEKLVEKRMKESAYFIASLWYTAWVNAGQPNMADIKNKREDTEINKNEGGSELYQDHER